VLCELSTDHRGLCRSKSRDTRNETFIRVDSSFVCSTNSHFFILQSTFGIREKQGELNPAP
jgi:hypothetical protein